MKYDFVEIGTSDFDTLIEQATDTTRGISIEPVRYYLDRLPEKPGVKKICGAVSATNRKSMLQVYYVPESVIVKHQLPSWLRGCNSVGNYHLQHQKLGIEHLVETSHVPCWPIGQLFEQEQVTELDLLKIDTEGQDVSIMLHLYEWLQHQPATQKPRRIEFESNELSDPEKVVQVVNKYKTLGYDVVALSRNETVLEISST
jgi:hypothetical protein